MGLRGDFDLSGQRFGRLFVSNLADERRDKKRVWRCRCDCGAEVAISSRLLRAGKTKSCGCLRRENTGAMFRKHGRHRIPEYTSWMGMRERCRDPKHIAFKYYGARGITVCPEWEDFDRFYADMGPRPFPDASIDRIDNDRGYEPGNCRWASRKEQAQNKRPRGARQ